MLIKKTDLIVCELCQVRFLADERLPTVSTYHLYDLVFELRRHLLRHVQLVIRVELVALLLAVVVVHVYFVTDGIGTRTCDLGLRIAFLFFLGHEIYHGCSSLLPVQLLFVILGKSRVRSNLKAI
jgi:hypothetical protein